MPLLIGINYAVTSSVPISISLPTNSAPPGVGVYYAAVTTNGASSYAVQWPLNFVFNESIGESDRVYSVSIEPFDPGGELTWSGAGGGMRSGASSECNCGCLHCGGYSVWFSCSAVCTCSGECQAVGNYTVEDALFAVTGGVCRCGFDDPVEIETTNSTPFSVSFSKQAVIFEDAYEARRGVMMPKRSSRVRITVDAYGGEYGGVLALLLSCIEPSGIEVREVDLCTYGLPAGKAGGIGLLQAFYVKPFTVSFSEIAVEEVPCDEGFAEGYFRHAMPSNLWSHTTSAGVGKWIDVFPGNRMGNAQFRDEAAIALEMLPITPSGTLTNDYSFGWMEGEMEWNIPFGWNAKGTTNGTEAVGQFEGTKQEFYIDERGFTGVRKFHNLTRTTNDVRRLNFKRIINNEVRRP